MRSKRGRKIKKLKRQVDLLAGLLAGLAVDMASMHTCMYTTNATTNLKYKYVSADGKW